MSALIQLVVEREEQAMRLLPGLVFSLLLALLAMEWVEQIGLQHYGLSSLTLAIVLGVLAGNLPLTSSWDWSQQGLEFSRHYLLRLGIVLYGFRLTFQHLQLVGLNGLLVDVLVLASTFILAVILGTRLFKLERNTAMLIGVGHSICGAAAIMAAEPVVKARADQLTVAVATIVIFGTLAIFVYPLLFQLNEQYQWLELSDFAYGIFIGSTVHEVAQVVAAADSVSAQAADSAVIAKMVRVMLLAPFLLALCLFLRYRQPAASALEQPSGIQIPWFAFIFIAVVAFNSLNWLAPAQLAWIEQLDNLLLTMAMAALGYNTKISVLRSAGVRPLLLAGLLSGWLLVGGGLINYLLLGS